MFASAFQNAGHAFSPASPVRKTASVGNQEMPALTMPPEAVSAGATAAPVAPAESALSVMEPLVNASLRVGAANQAPSAAMTAPAGWSVELFQKFMEEARTSQIFILTSTVAALIYAKNQKPQC